MSTQRNAGLTDNPPAMRLLLLLLLCASCRVAVDDAPVTQPTAPSGAIQPQQIPSDPERQCKRKAQGTSNTCNVSGNPGGKIVFHGNVASPGMLLRDGMVAIENGTITCVDCDCSDPVALTVQCPGITIAPGLVNSHDHLSWAHTTPKAHGNVRYNMRTDWREGQRGYRAIDPGPGNVTRASLALGELRFVMSGATSTVGSGGTEGFLRNLDRQGLLEGLDEAAVAYETFPLGSDAVYATDTCTKYRYSSGPQGAVGYPHVSEGVDTEAENEFRCLTSTANGGRDRLDDRTAVIHGIGLTLDDVMLMADRRMSLVWSPRTNIDLYGFTADVVSMARFGVNIAIGTDWIPSGSMNLSREMACVDGLNHTYLHGWFTDGELVKMLTENASKAAHMPSIGTLAQGNAADLALFKTTRASGYRAVLESSPESVALVMRGGVALYGDSALVEALSPDCETLNVCGVDKRVCTTREVGLSLEQLVAEAEHTYPLFSCDTPPAEPSCVPFRAQPGDTATFDGIKRRDDLDGDGVRDEVDNCPDMFNAPRPLDLATGSVGQPDYDQDGVGDTCDPCPIDADRDDCAGR